MCLTERSVNRNGIGRDGKPEGKKVGIYSFANLVLKLLFQVSLERRTDYEKSDDNSAARQDLQISSLPTSLSILRH